LKGAGKYAVPEEICSCLSRSSEWALVSCWRSSEIDCFAFISSWSSESALFFSFSADFKAIELFSFWVSSSLSFFCTVCLSALICLPLSSSAQAKARKAAAMLS
jgi:hypothetical protein